MAQTQLGNEGGLKYCEWYGYPYHEDPKRKLKYDIEAVLLSDDENWIGINQILSNRLVEFFFNERELDAIVSDFDSVQREVNLGISKLDFKVGDTYLEVKTPLTTINVKYGKDIKTLPPNQDWFPTFMMHIGGCGAETACDSSVYFALHRGLTKIAPENAEGMTRRDYVRFAYKMKPYLSPRRTGIDRLNIYMDGYAQYLRDCGETRLSMTPFDGTEPYEAAKEAIMRQIDKGYPVPTLILNHRKKAFRDYVWHWFLINGYDAADDAFLVKTVTYSKYEWLDLRELWDTGYERRGGFVLYHIMEEPES